jgi:hypothetical protein
LEDQEPLVFRNEFHAPIQTFVQAGRVEYHPAPTPVHDFTQGPLLVGRIPSLAASRQDRELDRYLAEALDPCNAALRCLVVSGLGGVGKTQSAAAYARAAWNSGQVDLLIWIKAAERDSIVAAYVNAAVQVRGSRPVYSVGAAQEFLAWLDQPSAPRWLIVLDDLNDPNDLTDLWPPDTPRGRAVVTTRRRDAALEARGRQRIDLGVFTEGEAHQFLNRRLGEHSSIHDGASELIEALDRLPIALAQAAAYILDQPGTTCRSFVGKLERQALLALRPEYLPDEYPLAVGACWALSIAAANRHEPLQVAGRIMNFLSLLDPTGVPAEFFTTLAARMVFGVRSPASQAQELPLEGEAVLDLLARLHKLSLIDYDGHTVRVHALVQRAVLDRLAVEAIGTYVYFAAEALAEIWVRTAPDPWDLDFLRANVARLAEIDIEGLFSDGMSQVLVLLGQGFERLGLTAEAGTYYQNLRGLCDLRLGPDHEDTLAMRHNHYRMRLARGEFTEAATALESLLRDLVRVFGPDFPETLGARLSLAIARGRAGDPARAESELMALLADSERVFGPDDPRTVALRSNIPYWNSRIGKFEGALAILLEEQLRTLGPVAPETIRTRRALILNRAESGDPAGAVADFRELHSDLIREFGSKHPEGFATHLDIVYYLALAVGVEQALDELRPLVIDVERVLGPKDPEALRAREYVVWLEGELTDADEPTTD